MGADPRRARADAGDAARLHHARHALHRLGAGAGRRDAPRAALRDPQRRPPHLGRRVDERRRDRSARSRRSRRRRAPTRSSSGSSTASARCTPTRTTPSARAAVAASAARRRAQPEGPGRAADAGARADARSGAARRGARPAARGAHAQHGHDGRACRTSRRPRSARRSSARPSRPLANGTSQPSAEQTVANLRDAGFDARSRRRGARPACRRTSRELAAAARPPVGVPLEYDVGGVSPPAPGRDDLDAAPPARRGRHGATAGDDVLAELPRVREELGWPIMVTPLSQFIGVQAVPQRDDRRALVADSPTRS